MVEVEIYGLVPPPGGNYGNSPHWKNERHRAEIDLLRDYEGKGFAMETRRVNVPFHPTGTSHELAELIKKHYYHPEWTDDEALRHPAFVRGSVYGQLAQSLLEFGKKGTYETNTHIQFAHFDFGRTDGIVYVAMLNEAGQFYIKKQRGHPDPWRKRTPAKPVVVRGYEVSEGSSDLRSEP